MDKWLGLIGICKRAGRLTIGFDAVTGLIREQKAEAVWIAADVSPKTAKELRFVAGDRTPVIQLACSKSELAAACGNLRPVGVAATADKGFAAAAHKLNSASN